MRPIATPATADEVGTPEKQFQHTGNKLEAVTVIEYLHTDFVQVFRNSLRQDI